MSIKAIFPAGRTELVAHGLHQWDYGQTLEIHDDTLPSVIEVHFACAGMKDAVVRSCTLIEGVATAAIPDLCLEQTTPVTAWVYVIEGTTGRTVRSITLPIIARPRPQTVASVPEYIGDRYTELVTAINEQVDALRAGRVIAGLAREAYTATAAERDTFDRDLVKSYLHTGETGYSGDPAQGFIVTCRPGGQPFLATWGRLGGQKYSFGMFVWDGTSTTYSPGTHSGIQPYYVKIEPTGVDADGAHARVTIVEADNEGVESTITESGSLLTLMPLTRY